MSTLFVGASYYLDLMSVEKATEAISAKQASHNRLTSRFGGLATIVALLIAAFFTADKFMFFIILSSIPILVTGCLDDLGYRIKPVYKLISGLVSGFIAIYLTGIWLDNVDLSILTTILALPFFAICFTAFASAGVSNSINLIDGVNGLASGIIIVISLALCIISFSVGEVGLGTFCIILIGSTLGFFIWNFPKGLIFLGDAGAYTYGHFLVWIAISLVTKYSEISAWAIACIFFWPLIETLASIFRRYLKRSSINQADYMHFHQLLLRFVVIYSGSKISRNSANPISTLMILPFCILITLLGVLFFERNVLSILTLIFATFIYVGSYNLLIFLIRSKVFRKFIRN